MNPGLRRALRAISSLWAGSLVGAALAFASQLILARQLGPASFGTFAAALSAATLLAPVAGFGVPGLWLRLFGSEGWTALRWLHASLSVVVVSTSCVILALIGWAYLGPNDTESKLLLSILSLHVVGQVSVDMVSAKLQLEGRFLSVAVWQVFPHFARLVALAALWAAAGLASTKMVAVSYAAVAVVNLVASSSALAGMVAGRINLEGHQKVSIKDVVDRRGFGDVAQQAWVFALSSALFLTYSQGPIVLMKYLVGAQQAGIYGIAYLMLSMIGLLPSAIYQRFLQPKLHRWSAQDPERLKSTYGLGARAMLCAGLLTMALVWAFVPWLVPLVFGEAFKASAAVACWLAICIPIRFLSSNVGGFMNSHALMLKKVFAMGLSVALNLVLAVAFIERWGPAAIVFASIASEAFLLVLLLHFTRAQVFHLRRA